MAPRAAALDSTVKDSSTIPAGFEDLRGRAFRERYAITELVTASPHRVAFVGTQQDGGRPIVLVLVRPVMLDDDATRERFERRVRACARVRHPAIGVPIDSGETFDGKLWLVFERPDGEPLDRVLAGLPSKRLPWAEARPLLLELVRGLAAAHARGVVHGSVSPSCCWVHGLGSDAPGVRLLDSGANTDPSGDEPDPSCSRTTTVGGDPVFMAPETAGGRFGDERSDVYLVGLLAWFMLIGRPPFQAGNVFQLVSMHLQAPVPTMAEAGAEVPAAVEAWVRSLLAKEPAQRPASMTAVEHGILALSSMERGAAAQPIAPASEEPTGTVLLTAPRAEPRAGASLDATLRLGTELASSVLPDATLMLSGAELAGGGALQPPTMVLTPEPRPDAPDPTATVALTADATMLARAAGRGPALDATVMLAGAAATGGSPARAEGAGQGATTVLGVGALGLPPRAPAPALQGMQAAPASRMAAPVVAPPPQAPVPYVPPAGSSMAGQQASAVERPPARSRLGLWMVIVTLVAAVAGVVVGLLLGGG